jgi:hypothetical protein
VTGGENIAPMVITRDDNVTASMSGSGGSLMSINMSLLAGRKYALQPALVPAKPRLYWSNAAPGDFARVSFPWTNASVKVWRDYDSGHPISAAASLAALDASTGNVATVFIDPI